MTYNLDANHKDIVDAFEQLGAKVIDNAKVKRHEPGQLDIWVGFSNPFVSPGLWIYVEIKTETGTLRPAQDDTIKDCKERGLPVEIVRSVADVDKLYHKYLALMRDGQFNLCPYCQQAIPIDTYICDECVPF